jgi:hypothetical protein
MIFELQERDQDVEKMRIEMQGMKEKLRALGLRVSHSNLDGPKRSKSMLPHQECDFEDCMEEDCAEGVVPQSERRSSSDHQMNTA